MIVQFALGHILLSLALGKNWAQHLSDRGNILIDLWQKLANLMVFVIKQAVFQLQLVQGD